MKITINIFSTMACRLGLASFLLTMSCYAADQGCLLDLNVDRPPFMQEPVDLAYEASAKYQPSSSSKERWTFNGTSLYRACYTNEHLVLLQTILNNPEQKTFYVIDVGSGDHRWVDATEDFINRQVKLKKIAEDVVVHIIGLTGETYVDVKASRIGNCVLHKYGKFKIEDFVLEMAKIDDLKTAQFDLAICNMALRHFVDPVRTFLSIRNRMKANRYFFFEKLYFLYENEEISDYTDNLAALEHILDLLADIGDPFLFESGGSSCAHATQRFVLKTTDRQVRQLPYFYQGLEPVNGTSRLNSVVNTLTIFKKTSPHKKLKRIKSESYGACYGEKYTLFGDAALYNEIDKMTAWIIPDYIRDLKKPSYSTLSWE